MQIFIFKAHDAQGRLVSGRVVSPSMQQVQKDAEKRGLKIVYLQPQAKWMDRIMSKMVKTRDRSIFYRQLATMLKAGVSITNAVDVTKQSPNKYFKKVISEISLGLENGSPLSKCLESYPNIFPEIEIGVIKAGEATGKLEAVLRELAEEASKSAAFVSKVRNAMFYPLFIVLVLIAVGIVVMVKIIPSIKEIFDEAKVQLPLSTRILIGISNFIIYRWWLALIIVAAIIGLAKLFVSTKYGKRAWSTAKINIPIFGPLQREVYLARFNRTFALLLKAGVPIIEAVNIVNTMTTNVIYREIVAKMAKSLEQGAPITSTLQASKYFPTLMTQLLYVGQQTGDMAGMCSTLSEYYEEEVETKLKTISSLLEPMIIILIGIGVGFVVVSILTPIYQLTNVYE